MSLDDLIWISIDDLICIMSLDGLIPSLGGGIATQKNLHQIAILVTKPLHFRAQIHDAFFNSIASCCRVVILCTLADIDAEHDA